MTHPMELVRRLENGSDRFLKWAYKEPYSGAPVISIPRHPDNIDALLTEAAACIREMVEALADARQSVCAFGAPWAVEYARNMGFPDGALHATHYDILEKSGARMVEFTRHIPPAPGAEA